MNANPLSALSLQHLSPPSCGKGASLPTTHANNTTANVSKEPVSRDSVVLDRTKNIAPTSDAHKSQVAYSKDLGISIFQTLSSEGAVVLQFPSQSMINVMQELKHEQQSQDTKSHTWIV